jgi:peptidyl-prolyl cis-trans isomerase A (cyclophilin A)/peptidyl-prolyl cis-trans isomerase B (cyclophilin B)
MIAAVSTGSGGPFPSDVPKEAIVIEEMRLVANPSLASPIHPQNRD